MKALLKERLLYESQAQSFFKEVELPFFPRRGDVLIVSEETNKYDEDQWTVRMSFFNTTTAVLEVLTSDYECSDQDDFDTLCRVMIERGWTNTD